MKKRIMLFTMAIALFACSCGKNEITARYFLRVQYSSGTKAHLDTETRVITYEDGDEIQLRLFVDPKIPEGLHGGLLPSEYSSIQSINAKMVYNRGEWSTFRLSGEYWVAVDCIVVSAPSTKYDIHFISDFDNKDQVGETSPERFRTWNNYKIPFRGGDQILDITLPSCAIVE